MNYDEENRSILKDMMKHVSIQKIGAHYVHTLLPDMPYLIQRMDILSDGTAAIELLSSGLNVTYTVQADAALSPDYLHTHDSFVLTIITKGGVKYNFGNHFCKYTAGHCFLVNRRVEYQEFFQMDTEITFIFLSENMIHAILKSGEILHQSEQPVINLLKDLLHEDAKENIENKQYYEFTPASDAGMTCITNQINSLCSRIRETNGENTFLFISEIEDFCKILLNPGLFNTTRNQLTSAQQEYLYYKVIQIIANRHGRIKRSELSGMLNYNGEYLNQIVRNYSGKNLTELCLSNTLHYFARQLVNTDIPIADLLHELQIGNRYHFYKKFEEKYGMTPLQYRKKQGGRKINFPAASSSRANAFSQYHES